MPDDEPTAGPDLTTVTTDELITELKDRCDVFVAFMRPKIRVNYDWSLAHRGSFTDILGLIEWGKALMVHNAIQQYDPPDEDDVR